MSIIYEPSGRAKEYSQLAANLYRGCGHACTYCYAPDAIRERREKFYNLPIARQNILKELEKDCIRLGGKETRPVLLSFTSDPYQPLDEELQITREAIKLLKKHKLSPVCFICIGFPNDTEESIRKDIKTLLDLKVKLRVQILWAYPGVDFQGQGLSAETLKQLQRDAMYGSNSVAWRKKPKPVKKDVASLPL